MYFCTTFGASIYLLFTHLLTNIWNNMLWVMQKVHLMLLCSGSHSHHWDDNDVTFNIDFVALSLFRKYIFFEKDAVSHVTYDTTQNQGNELPRKWRGFHLLKCNSVLFYDKVVVVITDSLSCFDFFLHSTGHLPKGYIPFKYLHYENSHVP